MRILPLLLQLIIVPVTVHAWGGPLYIPVPPTLSLSAPTTGFIDEVVLIDARASTGVHNKPQSNGTYSFTMDLGDGTPLVYIPATGHAYRDAGTYTIRINGKNAAGEAATEVTQNITISAIPAATGGNVQTLTDSGNRETNKTNLQAAIDIAAAANTVEQEIILPNDFDVNGQINQMPSVGNKYITIKWSGLSGLPHKKRIDPPSNSSYPTMPTIFARNDLAEGAYAVRVPIPWNGAVKYYRWQGIHIARTNPALPSAVLFDTGADVYNGNDEVNRMTHHLIIDRMWFDSGGIATTALNNTCLSGLKIKANYATVADSWLAYFRLIGAGVDAEAMSVSISQGPVAVVNNFLVGSSENFNVANGAQDYRRATISSPTTTTVTLSAGKHYLPGGIDRPGGAAGEIDSATTTENLEVGSTIALPSNSCANGGPYCVEMVTRVTAIAGNNITFEAVPHTPTNGVQATWSDNPRFLEFRQNYAWKPNEWRQFLADGTTPNPSWDGVGTQIKNIWELKACAWCVIDSNVLRNAYSFGLQPYMLTTSIRNDTGLYSNTAATHNIQWSNNILRDASSGAVISTSDDGDVQNKVSFRTRDIFFVNNLFWNVGFAYQNTFTKEMMHLSRAAYNIGNLDRVFIMHNTFDGYSFTISDWGSGDGATNAMWFNNIHEFGLNGWVASDGGFALDNQRENIVARLPPGDATTWTKNMVVNPRFTATFGTYAPLPATAIPVGGVAQDGSPTVDTVAFGDQFVNYATGNFTLVGGSPGKNAATDGTDVGVNYPSLLAATLNTVTGDWTGAAGGAASVILGKVTISGRVSIQ